MLNYNGPGETVTCTAPRTLASGGALINSLFVVAAACGQRRPVRGKTVGGFRLTALSTDTAAVGIPAYWDNVAFRVTTTSTSNKLIGVFSAAKANGGAVATVRLNGISV